MRVHILQGAQHHMPTWTLRASCILAQSMRRRATTTSAWTRPPNVLRSGWARAFCLLGIGSAFGAMVTHQYKRRGTQRIDQALRAREAEGAVGKPAQAYMFVNTHGANEPNEDAYFVRTWGPGAAIGIIDGHGGPECAKAAANSLPGFLHTTLQSASLDLRQDLDPEFVLSILQAAMMRFDADLGREAVADVVITKQTDMPSMETALSGACASVALLRNHQLYVGNLGDCRVVVGRKRSDGTWKAVNITRDHHASDPLELAILYAQHPGEEEVVVSDGRVLGTLQPTRALGDHQFKSRVFFDFSPFPTTSPFVSPPYMIMEPEMHFASLDEDDKFLIFATDGLWDFLSSEEVVERVGAWHDRVHGNPQAKRFDNNPATMLIRHTLGGEDEARVAHNMTIKDPLTRRILYDDTTVAVVLLEPDRPRFLVERGIPGGRVLETPDLQAGEMEERVDAKVRQAQAMRQDLPR